MSERVNPIRRVCHHGIELPARGILIGMVMGSIMWAVVILIIWAFKGD